MALVRTNRDKYSSNNTVLPGIRRVQIDSPSCISTPVIDQIVLTTAATEVSYALPANTKQFRVRAQTCSKFQIAYQTGGTYYTIAPKAEYCITDICTENITLYFISNKANLVLEIESWS